MTEIYYLALFVGIFIWRYLRLLVHIVAYCRYKHTPVPDADDRTYVKSDCTVIVPVAEPAGNSDINECLESIIMAGPKALLLVVPEQTPLSATDLVDVRPDNVEECLKVCNWLLYKYPTSQNRFHTKSRLRENERMIRHTRVTVLSSCESNKRAQVSTAISQVKTKLTVLADDHIFWTSRRFLTAAIAPFENPDVGVVGTNTRARREHGKTWWTSFWNFLSCLYLERQNFEITASNNVDGGVSVISGRTSIHRTKILQDQAFLDQFNDERFFFGLCGPLAADDDNFITRWMVRHGHNVVIQNCDDTLVETSQVGEFPRFLSQALRRARTTFRSNTKSLFTDRTVWRSQPWSLYSVYIAGITNFALVIDGALFVTLMRSDFYSPAALWFLAAWIFASKMVKLLPHPWLHPSDAVFIPGYILFGYFHSLLKFYAMVTFWNVD